MYASYLVAILVIEHPASIVERLHIASISWPSIFHAYAWSEFRRVNKEMLPVVQLSLQLMEKR